MILNPFPWRPPGNSPKIGPLPLALALALRLDELEGEGRAAAVRDDPHPGNAADAEPFVRFGFFFFPFFAFFFFFFGFFGWRAEPYAAARLLEVVLGLAVQIGHRAPAPARVDLDLVEGDRDPVPEFLDLPAGGDLDRQHRHRADRGRRDRQVADAPLRSAAVARQVRPVAVPVPVEPGVDVDEFAGRNGRAALDRGRQGRRLAGLRRGEADAVIPISVDLPGVRLAGGRRPEAQGADARMARAAAGKLGGEVADDARTARVAGLGAVGGVAEIGRRRLRRTASGTTAKSAAIATAQRIPQRPIQEISVCRLLSSRNFLAGCSLGRTGCVSKADARI